MKNTIVYLYSVAQCDRVPELASKREQAQQWLTQSTVVNNCKAYLCDSGFPDDAINAKRIILADFVGWCKAHGFAPGNFEMCFKRQDCDSNNGFWLTPKGGSDSGLVYGDDITSLVPTVLLLTSTKGS